MTDFHYPGHSADRCHTVEGRHGSALMDHLVRCVKDSDHIDVLVPARMVDVRLDDHARVSAAVVQHPDGMTEEVPTGAVLMATNGFGAVAEMVARYLPEIAQATYHGSDASRGDALRIGAKLGAASDFLDAYQGHGALAHGAATLVGWATIMHGAVLLGAEGRRFGDETSGYSEYAAVLAAQPGSTGWIVMDERIYQACLTFTDFRQTVESGVLTWADDVGALAKATGLPADGLAAELAAAASVARGEAKDRFGRESFEAPLTPPYAAVRVVPALFHTQGGLVVDEYARVLRGDGSPIEGLYASGGAAEGISGHGAAGYLAGNGLLPALGLAYLAADHAADHAAVRAQKAAPPEPRPTAKEESA